MLSDPRGQMEIPLYQVDAFTDRLFWGNPAAVCLLEAWLPDEVMQAIALENNLPETAFLVPAGDDYALRWFTPATEVELCGHATLGAAHVVFRHLRPETTQVTFDSASGPLVVNRTGERIDLDFPALDFVPVAPPQALLRGLTGPRPTAVFRSMDYLVVYETEEQLLAVEADQEVLRTLDLRGVAITAPGTSGDFSSRWFGPKLSIPEDSVTGSAHCALVPYWAQRLGSDRLIAHQFSPRLGRRRSIRLDCALRGDRVLLGGATREYLTGTVRLTTTDLDQRPKEAVTP